MSDRKKGDTDPDAIVIGAGHNGLVCAAHLARAGASVLVLERRETVGGAAETAQPWPGYTVSTASYVVSLMPPRIVNSLQLPRFGYRITTLDPDYYVPFPDGSALTLWADRARTVKEIARFSRADAEAYREFDAHLSHLSRLVSDLFFVIPPRLHLADLPGWIRLAARIRRWRGSDLADLLRIFTVSAADFLDAWFQDKRVKGALGTQSILGAWCGPMSPGSAYVLLHHWMGQADGHEGAWGWVHGGMGTVGRVLGEAARAAGVEVRCGKAIRRVLVRNGRAVGVELADGSKVQARAVISAAHPRATFLELVGEENLAPEFATAVKRFRTRGASVKINAALADLPRPTAWKGPVPGDPHTGILAVSPSLEYLERAWDDAKYGRTSAQPYVEAVFPTVFEPDLAPEGHHVGLFYSQFGPYSLSEGSWDTERDAYAKKVIQTVSSYAPNLEEAVEHYEVLAPPDFEERYGMVGGNIFHGEMTPDQMFFMRPLPNAADYRTPIDGLYLCGSGCHPGGGVMGVPGYNCSRVVRGDLRWRRWRVLGR